MDRILALAIAAIGLIGIILSVLYRRIDQQEAEIRSIKNFLDQLNLEAVKKTPSHDRH